MSSIKETNLHLRCFSTLVLLAATAAGGAVSTTANAQPTAAIAEQLFRDGRALMAAGKTDEACEKFTSSQRLAPAVGTLLNLAVCREKQGRNATAWSLFADAEAEAVRAGDKVRATLARDHESKLAPELKKVVIEVPTPPQGMVVELDDVALPPGALGTEIPIDPGDHELVVTAPGKKAWSQAKLNLGPSAMTVHVRVELQDEAPVAAPPPPEPPVESAAPASPAPEPAGPSEEDERRESRARVKRIAGIAIGGAGIVAIAIGAGYGLTAIGRKNDESKYPDTMSGVADQDIVYNQAKNAQNVGFAFAGVGAAAVGVGVAMLVLSGAGTRVTTSSLHVFPTVAPGAAGAGLWGSF
jgi:hypothetical protein